MFDEIDVKTTITPILAIAGAILGLIGTFLGVLNLFLSWKSHRVSVHVEVKFEKTSIGAPADRYDLYKTSIIVTNSSYFAITVVEVGLLVGTGLFKRQVSLKPFSGGKRIESRDRNTYVAYIVPDHVTETGWTSMCFHCADLHGVACFYVVDASGKRFVGRSIRSQLNNVLVDLEGGAKHVA